MKFQNTGDTAEIQQVSSEKVQQKTIHVGLGFLNSYRGQGEKKLCLQNSEENISNLELYTHLDYINQI